MKAKKQSLSYVELSANGCDSIHLENLRIREAVFGGAHCPSLTEKDSKALAQAIIKLFESVAIKKKFLHRNHKAYKEMDYSMTMSMRGSSCDLCYIVPTEFVKTFVAMYDAMANATDNIYQAGINKGSNLLMNLSDGSVTMKDFEERISKEK